MKTRTQNLTALDFIYAFGLLVFGGTATVINIAFFSPILPGLSQKLYIIPGIFTWMAILYLLVVRLASETRKDNQSPSPVIVSRENTIQKFRDSKYYDDQKIITNLPYEMGWRYHTNENKFVYKTKNQ